MKVCCLALAGVLGISSLVQGQGAQSNWYFGNQAAIRFPASGPPVALSNSAMQTAEGCVSISDSTGQLLFYSNGVNVWNRQHQLMVNGTGLNGSRSSTQSAAAVPDPANPQRYYLFTVDAVENRLVNGLQYSIVDMSRQGGLGEVTAKNVRLSAGPVTERIALVPHANNVDTWVLVHGWESNAFYAYLLTRTGLRPAVVTNSGAVQAPIAATGTFIKATGYLQASATGTRLVMGSWGGDVELFDFDPATGQLSNDVVLPGAADAYGVAFSPDGRLLYATRRNPTAVVSSTLYQYDLLAGSGAAIASSGVAISLLPRSGGAIQPGPDGRLYLSIDGSGYLSVINQPNARGAACAYQENGVSLAGKQALSGLPNQRLRRVVPPLAFAATAACAGSPVAFAAHASAALSGATFRWDFGDGAGGTGLAPSHAYAQAGTYLVTLSATHPTLPAPPPVTQAVTVYPVPLLRLPADTVACLPVQLQPRGDWPAGSTFRWQDGSTAATYSATAAGTYTVSVTTPRGCVTTASCRVTPAAPPIVQLGPDTVVCASARWVLRTAPQPPGTTYRWADGSTNAWLLAHGPGTYTVEVRGPGGCTVSASRTARDQNCPVLIPNVITPDGDGRNDAFVLQGLATEDWHLTVFNRWGQPVHDQPHYDNRWQASELAAGTYHYLLRNAYTGQRYRGWVEVLRPD